MDKNFRAARKYRSMMLFAADKIYSRGNLVKMGSWNTYCLPESSD
jgi:hypothetical protein